MPPGSKFVSAKNSLYEITDWQKNGSGEDVVYLNQGVEGVDNLDGATPRIHSRFPLSVWQVSVPAAPAPEMDTADLGDDLDDLEETPGASAPDDFDTVDDEQVSAEPDDDFDGYVAESIDVPADEPEAAPEIPADDTVDDLEVAPEPIGETAAFEPEVPVSAAPEKPITWTGANKQKGDFMFDCAKRCMTIGEVAQLCIDKEYYSEIITAQTNVRRWFRRAISAGFGIMFVGDVDNDIANCRVHLTKDGVTPFIPPMEEATPIAGEHPQAAAIRANLGIAGPDGLPPALAAVLAGLTDDKLGLSAGQLRGIALMAHGLALIIGGRS